MRPKYRALISITHKIFEAERERSLLSKTFGISIYDSGDVIPPKNSGRNFIYHLDLV